ncbi:unnamed protein product [marine sediment metagenome]|uniref:SnoaL-like domain-containing protein n=1 Tax=marine sediment metagenome TaxID=412755 RepID=X1GT96_9ZZZZ
MSRKLFILIFVLSCLALSASVFADEKAENKKNVELVREVVTREIESGPEGDAEKYISCYHGPSFVQYRIYTTKDPKNPNNLWITSAGPDAVRASAENLKKQKSRLDEHPELYYYYEVQHVHVMGDNAIAVPTFWQIMPDQEKRERFFHTHQTLYMLTKIKGEWKITSKISHMTSSDEIVKMRPY